jgi:hypothetical protein
MKRLFTFGCSCTNYMFPTWADILIHEYENQGAVGYNYGKPGLGNQGIFTTIMRADAVHQFTKDDIIAVVWSSWSREDRFLNNRWEAHGNVLNNDFYDDYFIKKYWSLENDVISNITAISSARRLFNLQFQGSIRSVETSTTQNDLLLRALNKVKMPHSLDDVVHDNIKNYTELEKKWRMFDGHPTVVDYALYAERIVAPALGIKLSDTTKEWVAQQNNEFLHSLLKFETIDELRGNKNKGTLLFDSFWDDSALDYLSYFSKSL